jgi:hypothetical protein
MGDSISGTNGQQRHLVTVWNPSYSADPMDSHLAVLLKSIEDYRNADLSESEVYVWWAKVRSRNRVQDLPHDRLIKEVADSIPDALREVHLYLTDYRSLYVGNISEMTPSDVRDRDAAHVADYIRRRARPETKLAKGEVPPYALRADWWFKLSDIRRIVLDDTVAVVSELSQLNNLQYHNKPVSLYGGIVDLPLIVTTNEQRSYFSAAERDFGSERKWWAELDAQRGRGIAEIERDLRDNVLGEATWAAFDPTARAFIADAERLFRAHRKDPAFDFSGVILNFAKAIEVHYRALIRSALAASPQLSSVVKIHNKDYDLRTQEPPALGQIAHLTKYDAVFRQILKTLKRGDWLATSFLSVLGRLAPVRNDAAHDERIDLPAATEWRNALLGVGCGSILVDLAQVERGVR